MGSTEVEAAIAALREQLDEIRFDLRCALAFSRTALRAAAEASPDGGAAAADWLEREAALASLKGSNEAEALVTVLEGMREQLAAAAQDYERARLIQLRKATA
jgi:hypothetical protein